MIKFENIERINEIRISLKILKFMRDGHIELTLHTKDHYPRANIDIPKKHVLLAIDNYWNDLIIELQSYGIQYKD